MKLAGQVEWTLASSNAGKLAEYQNLLADMPIVLRPLNAASPDVPEETGTTFIENALIKARHAARVVGRPAIADDSGLCVDALGGAPGVQSARYAGPDATDSDNIQHLLGELEHVADSDRQAFFYCVIVALRAPDDPTPVVASGRWQGHIATDPKGDKGFGYDPVFIDPELGLTAAELSREHKNSISHRSRASAELIRKFGLKT